MTSAIHGVSAGDTTVSYTAQGYARGYSILGTYNNILVTFHDNINVTVKENTAPDAPKREDLHGILGTFVEVKCISEGDGLPHGSKTYSTWDNYTLNNKYEAEVGTVYQDGDDWKVDVTLNGDVYASMYKMEPSFGTGVEHKLASDEDATKTITLTWDATTKKWTSGQVKGTVLATFKAVCEDTTAPKFDVTKTVQLKKSGRQSCRSNR